MIRDREVRRLERLANERRKKRPYRYDPNKMNSKQIREYVADKLVGFEERQVARMMGRRETRLVKRAYSKWYNAYIRKGIVND